MDNIFSKKDLQYIFDLHFGGTNIYLTHKLIQHKYKFNSNYSN